ncbi:hypothetical protein CYMTET_21968 [Cymbomonas tetramitiformis]|uniref:Uncharacterized protein n=1 Tax=Cymbomonas tetramitiformis TaxID=36881 RepID=A0AAE0C2G0_9CHLO|nr:hypothetical protein CYMTET_43939 [Cymbomonas tetramitiformis]KAK3269594.1 hypothetical protein CYMTET_21968 [Cymbomonas tetramitiformis]
MQETDTSLELLKDDVNEISSWVVKDIEKDIIIPELEHYFATGGLLSHLEYKAIGDGFTHTRFDDTTIPNEQVGFYLLDPRKKYNSTLQVRPIAFSYNVKESRAVSSLILGHVEKQLPRDGVTLKVQDPITGDIRGVKLTGFKGSDVASENLMYNVDGTSATHGCSQCFGRFNPNAPVQNTEPVFDPASLRTLKKMRILGEINQHYYANMTSAELKAQKDVDRLPELFEASGMEIPNWNRKPSTLCTEINIACKNQRGPPLKLTEPENSVMESCHWFLNINRGWRCCYLQKLGEQVDQDIKLADEAYLGSKRPLKGWDATASVKLLVNPC